MRTPSSMTSRLWRGCVVFALLILGSGALIYSGVRYQDVAIRNEVQNILPLEIITLEVTADFANSQGSLAGYLLTRQPQILGFYSLSTSQLKAALGQLRSRAAVELQPYVISQQRLLATWLAVDARVQALPAGDPQLPRVAASGYPSAAAFEAANGQMLVKLRAESQRAINHAQHVLTQAEVTSAILAGLAMLLALLAAFGTIRGITRPLRSLTSTVHRLSAGDHAARANLTGASEAREVALSINALADESDRLREQDALNSRLRAMAREAGLRIREHLHADEVLREARTALEENLDADFVYLHVIRDGKVGPPEGHEQDWLFPADFMDSLPPETLPGLREMLRNRRSQVIQDVPGPEGDRIHPEIREPMREAGIVSHLTTPFGVGNELMGIINAERLHPGQPWTDAEVGLVESIAADLGRGLHHARLYEEENRLVEELTAVDRVKSDFVATVSHELRTPLTSVTGYVEMLLDRDLGELSPEQERTLETIDRNATRLKDLIEDLLTLSSMESGTFTMVAEPVNLLVIISGAADDAAPAVSGKGLTLTTTCPRDGVVVTGDSKELVRVLANLLSNAVKFTPAGGHIDVTAQAADGWAVVCVTDTGIGIPSAERKDISTRFFRASNATKQAIPGTGLGLAIVRTIVVGHGGDLRLESREGKGTTVRVRLPLAGPAAEEPAAEEPRHGTDVRRAAPAAGVRS
jgi:two-component system, OmpR family, phosphate regulon sensor histidine kinase PhoR